MGPIFERTIQMSKLTLSSSLSRLGTETAYAVSEEAKVHAAAGNKVYLMHIGDLNFPMPQCIKDVANGALEEGKMGYCLVGGIPALRSALAAYISGMCGVNY